LSQEDSKDSDAEFEQMLKEAEDLSKDEADAPTTPQPSTSADAPKKKAKTKIGNKHRKKAKKKPKVPGKEDEEGYEVKKVCMLRKHLRNENRK